MSVLGDSILAVVLLLRINDSGAGPWAVTGLLVVEALPLIMLMGVAGHVADRRDSRRVLTVGIGVQVMACCALVFASRLVVIYLLVAVVQTAQAFVGPTWTALGPRIVGEDRVGELIALQQGVTMSLGPIGGAIGAVIYGVVGAKLAVAADAATFAVLLIAALAIRTRRNSVVDNATDGSAPRTALTTAGVRVVRADPVVWPLLIASLLVVLVLGGVNVVEVFLVRDVLRMSAGWYGLGELVFTLGAVAGSVLAARVRSDGGRVRGTLCGFMAIGVGVLVDGVSPWYWLVLMMSVVIGVACALMNACFGALFVGRTADADRGKVSAAINGLMQVANVVSLVAFGGLGSWLGIRQAFVIGGCTALVVTILALGTLRVRKVSPVIQGDVVSVSGGR